jgi:hypothetical protein
MLAHICRCYGNRCCPVSFLNGHPLPTLDTKIWDITGSPCQQWWNSCLASAQPKGARERKPELTLQSWASGARPKDRFWSGRKFWAVRKPKANHPPKDNVVLVGPGQGQGGGVVGCPWVAVSPHTPSCHIMDSLCGNHLPKYTPTVSLSSTGFAPLDLNL